ncbi:MAG: 50S ribosomal protein L23 [Clostridia bacterium]|nr:50S ribosomal protein L23 [Clostridia bacterium]
MKFAEDIIIAPIITEESMSRLGGKKYTFRVAKNSTKPEIVHAVEELFKVKVKDVNTMNVSGKIKRRGYTSGATASWKKAIVTLTEDSKPIEFFEGLY